MTARAPGQHQQNGGYGNGRQQPPPQRLNIAGTYSNPDEIRAALESAEQYFNVVGSLAFGDLPEGFSVVLSTIKVDVRGETYDAGMGKRGLGSPAVRRIAGAAGVSNVASTCKGWARHYAAWEVTVARLELDGTVRRETGNRVMDLRDGSSQASAMRDKVVAQNRREQDPSKHKDPDAQLREQRLHIGAHAETKAWLRAVRTLLGIRTYTSDELAKPFVVAKLQFTGRTSDPQLRVMFAHGLMSAALGGVAQLYGAPAVSPYQFSACAPPPPQLGMGGGFPSEIDGDVDDEPPPPARRNALPPSDNGPQNHPASPSQRAQAQRHAPPQGGNVFTIPGGREKGAPITDASDECLAWWADRVRTNLDNGQSKYPDRDQELLAAMEQELRRRRGEDQEPPHNGGAPPDDDYGARDPDQM